MNSDFPRIITLLRKERNISQKQAAADLNVSQALLSHYEKGIRECGLDFLVRAADYYNVSCDYLLGRSPEPSGKQLSRPSPDEDSSCSPQISVIKGSAGVVMELAEKTGGKSLFDSVYSFFLMAVYKMFRTVYFSSPANDKRMFAFPENSADKLADSVMALSEAKARCDTAARTGEGSAVITTGSISAEHPDGALLLAAVKASEEIIAGRSGGLMP